MGANAISVVWGVLSQSHGRRRISLASVDGFATSLSMRLPFPCPGSFASARRVGQWLLAWLPVAIASGLPSASLAGVRLEGPRVPPAAYGFDQLHPAWLQGTYWAGRPWPAGWYRATPARWSVEGVAPGREIVAAVNGALAQGSVAIPVPGTARWLNVATVEALTNGRITFVHSNGGPSERAVGDCQLGLLDGRPARGQGVHLLHAACVVAYGRPN